MPGFLCAHSVLVGGRLTFSRDVFSLAARGLPKILLVNDVVAVENGARLMAGDQHRDSLWRTGTHKVAYARSTQVMEELFWFTGIVDEAYRFTGRLPCHLEVADWFPARKKTQGHSGKCWSRSSRCIASTP